MFVLRLPPYPAWNSPEVRGNWRICKKAADLDAVSPRVLKASAEQLNLSLTQNKVPVLWDTFCLVQVPKQTNNTFDNAPKD